MYRPQTPDELGFYPGEAMVIIAVIAAVYFVRLPCLDLRRIVAAGLLRYQTMVLRREMKRATTPSQTARILRDLNALHAQAQNDYGTKPFDVE